MNLKDFGDLMLRERMKEKLYRHIAVSFPKQKHRGDDWAQKAVLAGIRKCWEFQDEVGALAYLMDKVVYVAREDLAKEAARRETLSAFPKYKQRKDPMRHIDYKIDLERAVKSLNESDSINEALWAIYYEGATWEDVTAERKNDGLSEEGFRTSLKRAVERLKEEMRRKDYRTFKARG